MGTGMMGMPTYQQGQQNNILLKNQQEQMHASQIKFIIEKVWDTQNQPELNQTLLYLGTQLQ